MIRWRNAKNEMIKQKADYFIESRFASIVLDVREDKSREREPLESYLARGGKIIRLKPAPKH